MTVSAILIFFHSGWTSCKVLALLYNFGSGSVFFHFSAGARFIPKYIYIWFVLTQDWYRFVSIVYIGSLNESLNARGLILDLFEHPIIAHLGFPRSMPAHVHILSSLLSCICNDFNRLAIATKSSTYVAEEIFTLDVPKVYSLFPCCNHLRKGSKNMMNRYGLRVFPCIVFY